MNVLRRALIGLWLLSSLSACATGRPVPEPGTSALPAVASTAILAPLAQRWQHVEDLRALMRVTLTSSQGRYSTRQTFFWRRPASVRLDTVSLFSQPLMTLVADPQGASIYYPQQARFFQGPATAGTFGRVIGLPLDLADVTPLLVGTLHTALIQQTATLYEQADSGMSLFRLLDRRGRLLQDVWVDPNRWLPQRAIRYTLGGLPAVDITYGDFKPTGDLLLPFELRIWVPHLETEVRLQFLSIDLNPGLPSTVFQLSPPAGVQASPLE